MLTFRVVQDQDALWAVHFAAYPATVTLFNGDYGSQSFDVQPGVNKLFTPLSPNTYIRGMVQRNGVTILDFSPSTYYFTEYPTTYNYNAFTAFDRED